MNKQNKGKISQITSLANDIFRITLSLETMPDEIRPGQFLNIKIPNGRFILRRPFGICAYDYNKNTIDFCFQIKGEGTHALAQMQKGDTLDLLLPLGNGFPNADGKKIALLGGGIGVFPLLLVAAKYKKNCLAFLGFRNKDSAVLTREFENLTAQTLISSDDGTIGKRGLITDLLSHELKTTKPDIIFACGPAPMLRTLKKTCENKPFKNIEIYVSLEERMACGFGACLCCNTEIQKNDAITKPRICCEGPVFNLREVIL